MDLEPALEPLRKSNQVDDIVVWDNSYSRELILGAIRVSEIGADYSVYGRYKAIHYARHPLVITQDDDVVLPPESIQALIDKWEELAEGGVTDVLVANQPVAFRHSFYDEHCLVGFGAVFQRDLPARAFKHLAETVPTLSLSNYGWWLPGFKGNDHFLHTCDIVFTALTPRVLVDVPYENLPWAEDDTRMYRQNGHVEERARMLELVRQVRDA